MSVAKTIEVSAASDQSFEDAIRQGISTAGETVHNIQGAWIKEQKVVCESDTLSEFRVDMYITFIVDQEGQ